MIAPPVSFIVDASVTIKLVVVEVDSNKAHDLFAHLNCDPAADIASAHDVSASDAVYVAAADSLGLPLITADIKLVNKVAARFPQVLLLSALTIPSPPSATTP